MVVALGKFYKTDWHGKALYLIVAPSFQVLARPPDTKSVLHLSLLHQEVVAAATISKFDERYVNSW
jgi:hypothetical protein